MLGNITTDRRERNVCPGTKARRGGQRPERDLPDMGVIPNDSAFRTARASFLRLPSVYSVIFGNQGPNIMALLVRSWFITYRLTHHVFESGLHALHAP
jgi:hypothetical protein